MKYAAAATVLLFTIVPLKDSHAGHETPLYQAACEYREAVREFERGVFRAHCFNRYDERLVDRLEDATSRLRSAARHPDRLDRLTYEWDEIQCLQPRVEATIFDPNRYPPHPALAVCWERVKCAGNRFANELLSLSVPVHHHRYGHPAPAVRSFHGRFPAAGDGPQRPIVSARPPIVPFGYHASSGRGHSAGYGNVISIGPQVDRRHATHGSRPSAEATRRDLGAVIVGAMLTRLLD